MAVPTMVILRVTGLDGKVLCGPEDVSLAECVDFTLFGIDEFPAVELIVHFCGGL